MTILVTGCATGRRSNTSRTGTEQLLISGAVEDSLNQFDFQQFSNRAEFLNDKYLNAVDKEYLVGALRSKILSNGVRLVEAVDTADIVLEARSAGVGTDSEEGFIGVPALAVPGMAIELPEVKLLDRTTQFGTARIGLIAYNAKTGEAVGVGGESFARTSADNWYVLGIGPYRDGTLTKAISKETGTQSGILPLCPSGTAVAKRKKRSRC